MEVREPGARYLVRPAFKRTDIGLIPVDWELKTLGSIAEVGAGSTPSRKVDAYWGGHIPWVTTAQIDFNEIGETTEHITELGLQNSAVRLLTPGTLLMALYGQGKTRGKIAKLGIEATTNQACASIAVGRSASAAFVFHCLASQYESIRKLSNSGSQDNLNGQIVKSIRVPLPPNRSEQEAIAEALSDADALIESLEQLLAKKRQIKQGAMQELLTGQRRLSGFADEWIARPLGSLGHWCGGMTPSMRNPDFWQQGGVPWVASGDVKMARLSSTALSVSAAAIKTGATTSVPVGSVLVVVRSGILRRYLPVAITSVPMAINQDVKALIPDSDVLPEFVLQALSHFGDAVLARCLKSGTTVESIELKWLKAFTIGLPSREEQTAIATTLSDMDAEITALQARLAKARLLKQGMAQALLTGRIRLV
jgi:type I restriction enzyme, S subunit